MNTWTSQNKPGKQTVLAVACAVIGLVLMYASRHVAVTGTHTQAAFGLGLLLLVIGVWGWLASGTQTVVVDPRLRRITITDVTRLATKSHVIRFDEVTEVGIGYLGKKSNFVQWYYLVLHFRGGKTYPLFAPGRFFAGASDRATVEAWRQRLEQYLQP